VHRPAVNDWEKFTLFEPASRGILKVIEKGA
jgi:hypothetical protein